MGPKWRLHRRLGPGILHLQTFNMATTTRLCHHTKPPSQIKISRRGWGLKTDVSQALNGVFFFSFFFDYTYLYSHLQLQLWNQLQLQLRHQQPARKGPNDVYCVVWALCEFFIYIRFFFYMLNGIYRYYPEYSDDIWALSNFYFFIFNYSLFFLLILTTIIHRFSNDPGTTPHEEWEQGKEGQGLETQHVSSPWYIFFFLN